MQPPGGAMGFKDLGAPTGRKNQAASRRDGLHQKSGASRAQRVMPPCGGMGYSKNWAPQGSNESGRWAARWVTKHWAPKWFEK